MLKRHRFFGVATKAEIPMPSGAIRQRCEPPTERQGRIRQISPKNPLTSVKSHLVPLGLSGLMIAPRNVLVKIAQGSGQKRDEAQMHTTADDYDAAGSQGCNRINCAAPHI